MVNVKIIFGGARVNPNRGFEDEAATLKALDILEAFDVDTIDTSRAYGNSERILGRAGAAKRFQIHTKIPGGLQPGSLCEDQIKGSVDVLYFHTPDSSTPIEQALDAMHDLYNKGLFSKFGLSNYLAHEVEQIHEYCWSHKYVLPSVYQGNFNPLARRAEELLLPTLRRLGISFHVYSPIAGGILAKTRDEVLGGLGRFVNGSLYWKLYVNSANLEALAKWADIAKEARCHTAELAYRWMRYNSPLRGELGDAMIIGANGPEQLQQTLRWLELGPLDQTTCERIDRIWDNVREVSPLDNFHG
ncbi:putative aldehyde reductase [Nemania abortiva]|nr:putative aldehyde reductase [Nemania abortiva]